MSLEWLLICCEEIVLRARVGDIVSELLNVDGRKESENASAVELEKIMCDDRQKLLK